MATKMLPNVDKINITIDCCEMTVITTALLLFGSLTAPTANAR